MAADGDLDQRLVTVLDVEATIAKIFAVFDKDGDGTLDKAELTSFARAFQKPVPKGQKAPANADNVDKILTAMDFNDSDGKIQLEEFETYLEAVLAAKFSEYDSNNDGVLRIDEMVGLVADMCDPTSRSRKKDKHFVQKKKKWFMRKFDKDHSGSVSPFEFQAFFLKEMDLALSKWQVDSEQNKATQLPYLVRSAVNLNPGQMAKAAKKLQALQADKVAKAREAGYHLIESSDEFEIVDVTDANQLKQYSAPVLSPKEKYNRWELEQQLNEKEQAKVERAAHNLHKLRQDITPRKLAHDAAPAPSKLTKCRVSKGYIKRIHDFVGLTTNRDTLLKTIGYVCKFLYNEDPTFEPRFKTLATKTSEARRMFWLGRSISEYHTLKGLLCKSSFSLEWATATFSRFGYMMRYLFENYIILTKTGLLKPTTDELAQIVRICTKFWFIGAFFTWFTNVIKLVKAQTKMLMLPAEAAEEIQKTQKQRNAMLYTVFATFGDMTNSAKGSQAAQTVLGIEPTAQFIARVGMIGGLMQTAEKFGKTA